MTQIYTRTNGKYAQLTEQIGWWCSRATIGHKIIIATPMGNYVLRFDGEFKPKTHTKIEIDQDEVYGEGEDD